MPKTVELLCEYCGETFQRLAKEHTRNQKKGRRVFCCLSHERTFQNYERNHSAEELTKILASTQKTVKLK